MQQNAETHKLLAALAALYGGPDSYYINFYGPSRDDPLHPIPIASDGGSGETAARSGSLSNNMVFVGYSDLYDPDQPDRFYTSFTGKDGVDLSGVEIMATAYANLLTPANASAERARGLALLVCGIRACRRDHGLSAASDGGRASSVRVDGALCRGAAVALQ